MSKLSRITQKIFGSGAGSNQIGVFGSLFATGTGVTTTDPSTAQSLSNWLTGWFGAAIGGNAPAIEDMNAVCFVLAYQLAYIFQAGVPEYDSDTTYFIGSFCSSGGVIYKSTIDDNIGNDPATDTVSWVSQTGQQTGFGTDFWGSSLPAGFIWASGKTVGNGSSNATERANADTFNLFKLFWDNYANTVLPIYDSAGLASTRGVSALADFNANKAIAVIDKRGRVSVGKDNLGGTAASRITATTVSPDGNTLGANGGEQTHVLTALEMAVHTHAQAAHGHQLRAGQNTPTGPTSGRGFAAYDTYNSTITNTLDGVPYIATAQPAIDNAGGDQAHNNVQPSILCNYIIKL